MAEVKVNDPTKAVNLDMQSGMAALKNSGSYQYDNLSFSAVST